MIIAKITAGLGNQLFQYALGLRLASAYDTTLKLDLDFYDEVIDGHRADRSTSPGTTFYYLSKFNISADEATPEDLDDVVRFGRTGKRLGEYLASHGVGRALRHVVSNYRLLGRTLNLYIEPRADYWRFNPDVLKAGPNAYLAGYWECPAYFQEIRDTLESEFTITRSISEPGAEIADSIAATNAVGIHVRRGVRVGYGTTVPTAYYQSAIDEFVGQDVTFFVFSVDPEWVRENLDFAGKAVYVDYDHPGDGGTTPAAYEYFELLRRCDHKIISNSTFSWWPAWLTEPSGGRILAPYQWRPEASEYDRVYVDEMELIPPSWEIVDWEA